MNLQLDNSNVSKHLGQNVITKTTYDSTLLVREPRQSNRKYLDIDDNTPPFCGIDIWNGYEISFLLNNGCPVNTIAKITYSATNKYIVESKSMKLYWNSFNMTKMGNTPEDAIKNVQQTAERDLSFLLLTNVTVKLFNESDIFSSDHSKTALNETHEYIPFNETKSIITDYNENKDLLKGDKMWGDIYLKFSSNLLRSNCRVTGAPDFGNVYIYYKGESKIDTDSLMQYIISFRNEHHFHEEICECLYKRLWDKFKPKELSVFCFYTRRGGWDINPFRASHSYLLPNEVINPYNPWIKTARQ